jgi:hypothetical protein
MRFASTIVLVVFPALASCVNAPEHWATNLEAAGLVKLDENYFRSVVTGYQQAQYFNFGRPQGGWSETANPDGSFTIMAVGSALTPRDRTRDIALARSGEKGVELKRSVFCIRNEESGFRCRAWVRNFDYTVHAAIHGHQTFMSMTIEYFDKEPFGARYCLGSQATIDHLKPKLDASVPARSEIDKHTEDARTFCVDAIANRRTQ